MAFICIRTAYDPNNVEKSTKEKLCDEYHQLFPRDDPNKHDFEEVYTNCAGIRNTFIYPALDQQNEDEDMADQVLVHVEGSTPIYFYSPSPDTSWNQGTHKHLLGFLHNVPWGEAVVQAYLPHTDARETIGTLKKRRKHEELSNAYTRMTVFLYTNRDKEVYTYHEHNKDLKLNINPFMSNRERTNDKFLYIISTYGSAATAALHYLSQEIDKKYGQNPRPASEHVGSPTTPSSIQSSEVKKVFREAINESIRYDQENGLGEAQASQSTISSGASH